MNGGIQRRRETAAGRMVGTIRGRALLGEAAVLMSVSILIVAAKAQLPRRVKLE